MTMKEFFSTIELAKILKISRIAIYKKVKSGKIKAIKIGRNYAIPRDEVNKIIGNILGRPLNDNEKKDIEKVVDRAIKEYGETLKLLGEE